MSNECTPVTRSNFASRMLSKAISDREKPGKTTVELQRPVTSSEAPLVSQDKEVSIATKS